MTTLIILYQSGWGHTAKVAQHVALGASSVPGVEAHVMNVEALDEAAWAQMDAAHGLIFGAPTYMGGVSARFKQFIDSASKRWFAQTWKDKIAAGFTNSGADDGDRLNTLFQLAVFAMQHSMIWVGTGLMREDGGSPETQVNRFGSFMGLMTQSTNEPPEVTPPACDLHTARLFGARVAEATRHFTRP